MRQPPVTSFKRIVAGTVVIGTVGTTGAAGTGASRPGTADFERRRCRATLGFPPQE